MKLINNESGMYISWNVQIRLSILELHPGLYQRLAAHNAGRGAKYTKCRIPVKLLYWEICQDRSEALKREAVIKKMKRNEKIKVMQNF